MQTKKCIHTSLSLDSAILKKIKISFGAYLLRMRKQTRAYIKSNYFDGLQYYVMDIYPMNANGNE